MRGTYDFKRRLEGVMSFGEPGNPGKKGVVLMKVATILFCILAISIATATQTSDSSVTLYFFWGQGCTHCVVEKPFLEQLEQKYPQLEVKEFETWHNSENEELFQKFLRTHDVPPPHGVPTTFVGNDYVVGYHTDATTGKQIEDLVKNCIQYGCPDAGEGIIQALAVTPTPTPMSTPTTTVTPTTPTPGAVEEHQELCIHVFTRENCFQCERVLPLLDQLEQDYNVTINKYDATNETNKELYEEFKELYGLEYAGFPAAFIGDRYLVGDRAIIENLEDEVKRCLKEGCPCPLGKIRGMTQYLPKPGEITPEEKRKIPISILGFEAEIGVGTHILLLGIILGTVDGVNPCVIAVFLYLMGVLFGAGGERRKILQIGFAFLATFFIIYFLYMLGLVNIFEVIFFLGEVKVIIAVFIMAAGFIMIKDFFWLGRWFSLKIPDSTKPTINKLAKRATLPSAVFLAAFSTLVGLPCTTGLVLSYITTMAEIGVDSASTFYLLWYNLFRTAPLLILITLIYWANLKVERAEEWRLRTRKYMRLISGVIMLALGISLLLGWI